MKKSILTASLLLSMSLVSIHGHAGFFDKLQEQVNKLDNNIRGSQADNVLSQNVKPSIVMIFNCFDTVLFERDIQLYDDIFIGATSYPQLNRVFDKLPDPFEGEDIEGADVPSLAGYQPKKKMNIMGFTPKKVILSAAEWGGGHIDLTLVSPYSVKQTAKLVQKKVKYPLTSKTDSEGNAYVGYEKIFTKRQPDGYTSKIKHSLTIKNNTYPNFYTDTDPQGEPIPRVEVACSIGGF